MVVWLEIVSLLCICLHTFGKIKLLKFRIFKIKKRLQFLKGKIREKEKQSIKVPQVDVNLIYFVNL